jgi:hypothetical protein
VENVPGPSALKAVANPAPQSLLQQSQPEIESPVLRPINKSVEETEQEVLKQRELEQEMENERPCVFKSISPVRSPCCVSLYKKLIAGMEQRQSHQACREDSDSAAIVGPPKYKGLMAARMYVPPQWQAHRARTTVILGSSTD